MMISRPRRTREVTGPTPASVAIKARPPNVRPPEYLILERRKQEEKLRAHQEMTSYMEVCDLKNEWERWTDRKIQLNTVKRRVEGLMQANEFSVEDRRERLRTLLRNEEQQYLEEMTAKEETTIERQAKMRERAKFLKDKREEERLQFVQDKLDQQFRNQCEELRSTLSKRQQDQVCAERLDQLRYKEEIEIEKAAQDQMYAQLWEEDRLKKAEREEREAKAQHERNREVLDVLRKQMAALEKQKDEERLLKDEEAQLLREQAALRKMEEQQAQAEKIRKQKETRDMLDLSLKMKMKKKAREEQEQLAFDLKMLEQLLEESRNEAMEQMQRKRELREEDRRYRDYLAQLMAEEKAKEIELERLINEEVEKMWQKRLNQWKLERLARKKLLQDVLDGRAVQIQERLAQNELRQLEAQREKEELVRIIEENKRLEQERAEKLWQRNMQYQHDLEGQIDHNNRMRDAQIRSQEEEDRLGMQAEREYQEKIKSALKSVHVENMHPFRRHLMAMQNQA
ncbi:cilia- and flagella-associated protein 53-like [Haliotis asinina]|uniref:cilia- and flagella-associated protein 53-like n=1 Tax=Haliotis asinina TaxID=109174 RepID=UPI003531A153